MAHQLQIAALEHLGLERHGLPAGDSDDLTCRPALMIDGSGARLAMGPTTGNSWVTGNQAADWQLLSADLPPIAALAFAP